MKILSVSMEGFGSFKNKEVVDFSEYDADGLFLITGPTGAGKSTILDAICFALYGDTPRWKDHASGTAQVRSDYCSPEDKTEVTLEFEANGVEYRIKRSPQYERPNQRRGGTTIQQATAVIEPRAGGAAIATKPGEVGRYVQSLVKLKADEFLQVILLAQNRFQKFLQAKSDERLDLLRTLFEIGRFGDYAARIDALRGDAKSKLDVARRGTASRIQAIVQNHEVEPPESGKEIDWITALVNDAEAAVGLAQAARIETASHVTTARERLAVAEKQQQRAEARVQLTSLESRADEIKTERTVLTAADRAARVSALADAAEQGATVLADAKAAVEAALAEFEGEPPADPAAELTRLDQEVGKLQPLVAVEKDLSASEKQLSKAEGDRARIMTRLAEIADRVKELEVLRKTAAAEAKGGPAARLKAQDLAAKLAAATSVKAERGRLASAQGKLLDVSKVQSRNLAAYNRTLERYLHGQAAVLAEHLELGLACPVCGSLDHPQPAAWDGEPVTEADVKEAEKVRDDTEAPVKAANAAVTEIESKIARLQGQVGDQTVDQLTEQQTAVVAEAGRADEADQLLESLDLEINGDERQQGLTDEKTQLDEQLSEASSTVTSLGTQIKNDRVRIDGARDEFKTVAARIATLTDERELARMLLTAQADLATADKQSESASTSAERKAKDEKFASLAAALAAQIDADELAERHEVVTGYNQELAAAKAVLAQAVLQDLPDKVIDLLAANEAVIDAESASSVAISAESQTRTRHKELTREQATIAQELGGSNTLAERYEELQKLAETVRGRNPNVKSIPLESYVAAAELEAVLEAANQRLRSMSDGRYELQHSERGDRRQGAAAGLEIEVLDEQTGRTRSPRSLSGGETFLASLALALGLAEVVTSRSGGLELKTLFIDEGFGSLDGDTLEIAMTTLDSLRQGGRAVGVISHVETMKERITSQLRVAKTAHGWSEITPS